MVRYLNGEGVIKRVMQIQTKSLRLQRSSQGRSGAPTRPQRPQHLQQNKISRFTPLCTFPTHLPRLGEEERDGERERDSESGRGGVGVGGSGVAAASESSSPCE